MSLAELLDSYVKESFCIDKINFNLECFNIQLNQVLNKVELEKLATHLASNNSHKSAVGVLNDQESGVGHAISMYDYRDHKKHFIIRIHRWKTTKTAPIRHQKAWNCQLRIGVFFRRLGHSKLNTMKWFNLRVSDYKTTIKRSISCNMTFNNTQPVSAKLIFC